MTEHDIMTLEEVAAYLKVRPQTIYTWAQEKRIPAAKLGKEWRFKKSVIDRWFDGHFDARFKSIVQEAGHGVEPLKKKRG
jgi:excisionase family DNA binding protein